MCAKGTRGVSINKGNDFWVSVNYSEQVHYIFHYVTALGYLYPRPSQVLNALQTRPSEVDGVVYVLYA